MRIISLVTSLVFIGFTLAARSQSKVLYFYGGGGESGANAYAFDEAMTQIPQLANRGWKINAMYAGPQNYYSKELARKYFGYKVPHFTSKNFKLSLKELSAKIDALGKEIGDEILVIIDTHGEGQARPGRYHTIRSADGIVNVADFDPLIKKALAKRIKFAIMDMSCYGGHTVESLPVGACGISLSRANRLAFGPDATLFYSELARQGSGEAVSVESVFLSSRQLMLTYLAEPLINTRAGNFTASALSALTPSLLGVRDLSLGVDHPAAGKNRTVTGEDLKQIQLVIGTMIIRQKNKLIKPKIWQRFDKDISESNSYHQNTISELESLQTQISYTLEQIKVIRRQIDPLALQKVFVTNGSTTYQFSGGEIAQYIASNSWSTLASIVGRKNANQLFSQFSGITAGDVANLNLITNSLLKLERPLFTHFYNYNADALVDGNSDACAAFNL